MSLHQEINTHFDDKTNNFIVKPCILNIRRAVCPGTAKLFYQNKIESRSQQNDVKCFAVLTLFCDLFTVYRIYLSNCCWNRCREFRTQSVHRDLYVFEYFSLRDECSKIHPPFPPIYLCKHNRTKTSRSVLCDMVSSFRINDFSPFLCTHSINRSFCTPNR